MNVNRKELILEAASKSFSSFGYKATTMDQIARVAKVGKGTIYTFYKNKEELFQEIISSLIKEMKTAAEEVMDDSAPFFKNADRVLYTLLEFRTEHQLMIKLLQEEKEIGTPAVTEVVQKLEDTIVKYMSTIIKEGIESGEIKDCDTELTAFVILKLYVSLIFDWEKTREPLEKDQISQFFHLYLMDGLSNK